jgi:hypothetical protein
MLANMELIEGILAQYPNPSIAPTINPTDNTMIDRRLRSGIGVAVGLELPPLTFGLASYPLWFATGRAVPFLRNCLIK